MSKGSSYWGTATGRIGNTVVRVRKGVRVESAYQPNVANPRSRGQVFQRGKFADAVGFYKRAMANFFKLAFEDKKSNETDFNAFMRHNISRGYVYSKQMVTGGEGSLPYIGKWLLSYGSLPNIAISSGSSGDITVPFTASGSPTMGEFWTSMVNMGLLQNGDIMTVVRIVTDADNAGADEYLDESLGQIPGFTYAGRYGAGLSPIWRVSQYVVDTTSEALFADQAWVKAKTSTFVFDFTDMGMDTPVTACAAAIILSRKTSNGLLCSTTPLVWNKFGEDIMTAMSTEGWLEGQRKAWSSSDVILAGALV